MSDSSHPCGTVPVRGWTVSIWWCERHQAWWGVASTYRQTGEGIDQHSYDRIALGPFDDTAAIVRWVDETTTGWAEALPAPGLP